MGEEQGSIRLAFTLILAVSLALISGAATWGRTDRQVEINTGQIKGNTGAINLFREDQVRNTTSLQNLLEGQQRIQRTLDKH